MLGGPSPVAIPILRPRGGPRGTYGPGPTPPPAPSAPYPLLRSGSDREAVVRVQKMLNSAGFPVGAVHGRFGPKTAVAVKKYQSSRGLSAEGIIGPKTWAVLKGGR